MTNKQLSPEAQAVFWAFNSKFDWIEDGVPGPQFKAIAAVLRAAADQAMPEFFTLGPVSSGTEGHEDRQGLIRYRLFAKMIRNRLLAIADELERPFDTLDGQVIDI